MSEQISDWIIHPMKPGKEGPNPSQLVNCRILKIADKWVFFGPDGTPHSTTEGTIPPNPTFQFPIFLAHLNGTTMEPWYITVTFAGDKVAKGYWGNQGYKKPPDDGDPDDDDDTWVAHNGATTVTGEKREAAGASSS
ncbi:MAG TPA: hypothetical protein VJ875_26830 [Pyrinomonadaceae bacterium]|nr:hypothetical protein [Pyrinomonadaceae bacterium]